MSLASDHGDGVRSLPKEILLEIFSWFPLRSLIVAQGVNQLWRKLVPMADLLPERRDLLRLFITVINSEEFWPEHVPKPEPFDREEYLAELLDSIPGDKLPEEFVLWMREWPTKTVVDWIWPSLPKCWQRPFTNRSLKAGIVEFHEDDSDEDNPNFAEMYCLQIAEHGCGWYTSLVLDGPREDLIGTVRVLEGSSVTEDEDFIMAETWTEWLLERWKMIEENPGYEEGELDKPRQPSYSNMHPDW